MRIQIPDFKMTETNPNVFALVFLVKSKTTFQLDFQKLLSADVICNEIGSLPVITEANGGKPKIS